MLRSAEGYLIRNRLFRILLLTIAIWGGFTIHPLTLVKGDTAAPRSAEWRPADFNAAALLIIHYHRADNGYTDWNIWAWKEGVEGHAIALNRSDSFGRIAIVPLAEKSGRFGLLVRRGEWKEKDVDQDRFVTLNDDATKEIWLVSGDPQIHSDPSTIDLSIKVEAAFLDSFDDVTLAASGAMEESTLRDAVIATQDGSRRYSVASVAPLHRSGDTMMYDLKLTQPIEASDVGLLGIRLKDQATQNIYARQVLDDAAFIATDATLGDRCTAARTVFATWSPVSSHVELLLYADFTPAEPKRVITMHPVGHGVWKAEVAGDLQGMPYRYRFTRYGETRTAADICTYAASADSSFSVVVDLDRLKPDGFDAVPPPRLASPTDEIIYELHTRDFSIADEACPPALRGTYLGLVQSAAVTNGMTRGLGHLKELGITAVHLLPIEQFGGKGGDYNWGYWTSLFNVPENDYSTAPGDPTRSIVELRQAITTLHRNNLRVLLDVVYNHASSAGPDSPFEAAVPFYFFRSTASGRLINDTGVGNTIADERPMVRKFIVDSLVHWLRDYHVDGFRFDLLGCDTPDTVKAICDALVPIRPDITLYGEPWTGGGPVHFPKGTQRGMHVAVFNDNLRNAIRGDTDGTRTGFADGNASAASENARGIERGVAGSIDDFANEPTETINYVDAHDNLTLWDKLTLADPNASDEIKKSMQKLSLGIVLTSQGIAFLHGGSEFCRTKGGNNNSYNAGDAVNAFDWNRKAQFRDVYDYVRGLITIRKAHPAFRISDARQVRNNLKFLQNGPLVSYAINGNAVGDEWRTVFVAYNGEPDRKSIELPAGRWAIVSDAEKSGCDTIREANGRIDMPAYSMVMAHQ